MTAPDGGCTMPGCERHTESWADLCNPCAVQVAELAESIGEPRRAAVDTGPVALETAALAIELHQLAPADAATFLRHMAAMIRDGADQ